MAGKNLSGSHKIITEIADPSISNALLALVVKSTVLCRPVAIKTADQIPKLDSFDISVIIEYIMKTKVLNIPKLNRFIESGNPIA